MMNTIRIHPALVSLTGEIRRVSLSRKSIAGDGFWPVIVTNFEMQGKAVELVEVLTPWLKRFPLENSDRVALIGSEFDGVVLVHRLFHERTGRTCKVRTFAAAAVPGFILLLLAGYLLSKLWVLAAAVMAGVAAFLIFSASGVLDARRLLKRASVTLASSKSCDGDI
jgi:hypothetical protein